VWDLLFGTVTPVNSAVVEAMKVAESPSIACDAMPLRYGGRRLRCNLPRRREPFFQTENIQIADTHQVIRLSR
jgi:hypothetical protein